MYVLQDVVGKGKGLVATETIFKGTRILSEEPLITIDESASNNQAPTSIYQQVEALSEHQRRAFLSLHNIHPFTNITEQYIGIVRTNSLPTEAARNKGGIFLEACRINHACDNNAQRSWNDKAKQHRVHALRDINKGEEITITYLHPFRSREARQKACLEGFNFICSCRLCSLPPDQSQESDRRLEQIRRVNDIIKQIGTEGVFLFSLRPLHYLDQQLRLYNEQGREDAYFAQALANAAHLAIFNSDLARGRIFPNRAASVWKTAFGGDSLKAIKCRALAHNPSSYKHHGLSAKWKTKVDDVPRGLEPTDFEDWLWRRQKVTAPGKLANMRSRVTFPGFVDLPDEYDFDPELYERSDGGYRPRRHWCFLGEVVGFHALVRLGIHIKDVNGTIISLFFQTDGRGSELAPAQALKGFTVAILNPERHAFMFDLGCIRHEDTQMIKIFPASMRSLLALNDHVQQFSTELNGIRTCHGCGKKGASLQRCGKCSFFWYCDRACQEAGWNEKGHKADCKLLEDPDLRGLFLLKWDEFDTRVRFPLQWDS